MPIYEYQCTACDHQLEAFQKITDEPLTTCPECHQQALSKLISSTTFQLKGTGWYATDFRDKGKPKQAAAQEGGDSSGTVETKKEAKTEAKTENKTGNPISKNETSATSSNNGGVAS